MAAATLTESILKHERKIVVAGLVVVCALAWTYLFLGAGTGMPPLDFTSWPFSSSPSMPMEHGEMGHGVVWSTMYWIIMLAMWWVMMIAMMVPSAAPTILLYARVHRYGQRGGQTCSTMVPTAVFALGYLLAWLGFSVAATALQAVLERLELLLPMTMSSTSTILSAAFLTIVGAYQLSPLKAVCLNHCRSPIDLIVAHWRNGTRGALRMGLHHGLFCVGCCWVLMTLLFVGGVMNLLWIAGLAMLVLVEKLAPLGAWLGRLAGFAMLLAGTGLLFLQFT